MGTYHSIPSSSSISDIDTSSSISIPPEILINEVLPRLSITELNKFCTTNTKLVEICRNEIIWKKKLYMDYPDLVTRKPPEMKYLDYYKMLYTSRKIPIYYHGDIIGYIPFYPFYLDDLEYFVEVITDFTSKYFLIREYPYIAYASNNLTLIAAYTSSGLTIFDPQLISNLSYIIIVLPEDQDEPEIFYNLVNAKLKGTFNLEARNIILSRYSKIAIYGLVKNTILYIIWKDPSKFDGRIGEFKPCNNLRTSVFMPSILYYLNIPLPSIPIPSDDEILKILSPDYGSKILEKYPRDQVEYFYRYIILGIDEDPLLCDKVKEALQKIDHYFILS